jgi:murein L,D-transpeptidase YcbB/YkuD
MSRMPYRLRQDTGDKNALGRVKFMFPNKYNVYIHDTPSKSLFAKDLRVFSHGCMRVQNPFDLAEVILKDEGWSRARIDAQVKSGKRRIVKLKRKIPVYVTYITAFANKDGSIHFRRDVYGRDGELAEQLLTGGRYAEADNH